MAEWGDMRISDGTAQADRSLPALQADYFNVDELLFEELLALAGELAGRIHFHDLNNRRSGDWGDILSADEAVIMAMILSADLKRAEAEFLQRSQGDPRELAGYVMHWMHRIDFWLSRLKRLQHRSSQPLARKIRTLLREKLAAEVAAINPVLAKMQSDSGERAPFDLSGLDAAWGVSQTPPEGAGPGEGPGEGGAALDEAQSKQRLRGTFYALRNAVGYLQGQVPIYLQESLHSGQHPPATGLLMVFLKLYQRAQQRLNRFTQRHLDFYYDQVLQARPLEPLPESVTLAFSKGPGAPVPIEQGREFSPGKDADLRAIVYRADQDLLVTDARITALRTLYLQHDELISPETDLGYVTRIKTAGPPLFDPSGDPPKTAWPLFGADRGVDGAQEVEIGFALGSSLLFLQEGVRRIELSVVLRDPGVSSADELLGLIRNCIDPREKVRLIGRAFSLCLLSGRDFFSLEQKRLLLRELRSGVDRRSARELLRLLGQDRQGLFYQWFKNAFSIRLSGETGWLAITDYLVSPLPQTGEAVGTGFCIGFTLAQEAPPILGLVPELHGEDMPADRPVLRCCLNPQSYLYAYSLFGQLSIERLILEVDVQGVKDILAYNNHGQLDPSKPFQPFGPIPRSNGYFVIGNYEAARKRLTELKLNLEWGELPEGDGGFAEHYRDYPGDYTNDSFKAELQGLAGGQWRTRQGDAGAQSVSLFDAATSLGPLRNTRVLDLDLIDDLKPIDASLTQAAYAYNLAARNGFLRLRLSEPVDAFGHGLYPQMLTRVLTQNARLKKPKATPPAPYTPSLNRITLDYRARGEFRPASKEAAAGLSELSLLHIHPFGVEPIDLRKRDEPLSLLPRYAYPGNLFIGLETAAPRNPLSLFFQLAENRVEQAPDDASEIAWFYLTGNGWRRLAPQRVLGDTTQGFLTSGILSLDLPADIARSSRLMPGDHYWLRVSVSGDPRRFAHCYAIQPHALRLTRVLREPYSLVQRHNTAGQWRALSGISGIDRMVPAGRPSAARAGETREQRIIRLSERLRHKQRALTPWDYEHLVLQQFPEVAKVKCFSHMASDSRAPRPGRLMIVPVPQADAAASADCERLMFSSIQLRRIEAFLLEIAPPFVALEVRNPVYEQIQVRCSVKFAEGPDKGSYLKRLDGDISAFICPWVERGYRARFGWSIRQKDIEARLRELDYVEFVTDFSMLHITRDSRGRYSLGDTAKEQTAGKVSIEPKYPWSLAVPTRHHFIETMPRARTIQAEVTGIDELEIGHTFIINGNSGNGEEE